jgi:ribosome-associated protein
MHIEDQELAEPSRSQLRREALDVFKLAEAIVALPESQLGKLPLSDELREEVQRARRITQQIARKRQIQFLAKQMRRREEELEPLRLALTQDRDSMRRETAELHRLEGWRDRLLNDGDSALSDLLQHFPHADRQHLRTLVRQAREDAHANKPPTASRTLFKQLRALFSGDAEPSVVDFDDNNDDTHI